MRLTREQRRLRDDGTPAQRKAMQILLALSRLSEAERLVPITSAHVSGASYKMIGDPGLEFLEDFARDARVTVPTTVNPLGTAGRERRRDAGIRAPQGRRPFADRSRECDYEAARARFLPDWIGRGPAGRRWPPVLPRVPRFRGGLEMARRGAGIDGRLCDVPPRRPHPRGAAGPHRRLALPHDLTGRSGAGSEVLHRRDESGRDRPRLAPTIRARTLERRGPRATEASPDPGLGLHEPRRPRREPGAGRADREPRRPRPRGHVPRGHAARASIRDGRHPFGKGRVLPAEPLQAEGHPRRARRPLGAVRMKLRGRGIASGFAEGTAFVIRVPFSFVGGADPATGTVLDAATGGANE